MMGPAMPTELAKALIRSVIQFDNRPPLKGKLSLKGHPKPQITWQVGGKELPPVATNTSESPPASNQKLPAAEFSTGSGNSGNRAWVPGFRVQGLGSQ